MTQMIIRKYPVDETGVHPDNLIQSEKHAISPLHRTIIPRQGYFYSNGLVARTANKVLVAGRDYRLDDLNDHLTKKTGKSIFASIIILDELLMGEVSITYQCYGTSDEFSQSYIAEMVKELNDPKKIDFQFVTNKPDYYPPEPHTHPAREITDWTALNILFRDLISVISHLRYYKDKGLYAYIDQFQIANQKRIAALENMLDTYLANSSSIDTVKNNLNSLRESMNGRLETLESMREVRNLLSQLSREVDDTYQTKVVATADKKALETKIKTEDDKIKALITAMGTRIDGIVSSPDMVNALNKKLDLTVYNRDKATFATKNDITAINNSLNGKVDTTVLNSRLNSFTLPYDRLTNMPTFVETISDIATNITGTQSEHNYLSKVSVPTDNKIRFFTFRINSTTDAFRHGTEPWTSMTRVDGVSNNVNASNGFLHTMYYATTTNNKHRYQMFYSEDGSVYYRPYYISSTNNDDNPVGTRDNESNVRSRSDSWYRMVSESLLHTSKMTDLGRKSQIGFINMQTLLPSGLNTMVLNRGFANYLHMANQHTASQLILSSPGHNYIGHMVAGISSNTSQTYERIITNTNIYSLYPELNGIGNRISELERGYSSVSTLVSSNPELKAISTKLNALDSGLTKTIADAIKANNNTLDGKYVPLSNRLLTNEIYNNRKDKVVGVDASGTARIGRELNFASSAYTSGSETNHTGSLVFHGKGSNASYPNHTLSFIGDFHAREYVLQSYDGRSNVRLSTLFSELKNSIPNMGNYVPTSKLAHPDSPESNKVPVYSANGALRVGSLRLEDGASGNGILSVSEVNVRNASGTLTGNRATIRSNYPYYSSDFIIDNYNGYSDVSLKTILSSIFNKSDAILTTKVSEMVSTKVPKYGTNGAIHTGDLSIYDGDRSLRASFTYDSGRNYVTTNARIKASDFYITSDRDMKDNLEAIDSALDKVKQLKGYTYHLKGTIGRSAGIIAQDVQAVLPEAVSRNKEGMLSVSPNAVVALLVNAITELDTKIDNLAQEIRSLKGE